MEFINSSGEAGENMGEELFNVLQRYGLVDGSQKFDLGELVVKADDSFVIPDPRTELAEIAAEAAKLEVEIGKLNGVITSLDGKIATLDQAIRNTTDPVLRQNLLDQKAELVAQKKAAEGQLEELQKEAYGLKAQFIQAKATADRLGLKTGDEELAAAKHLNSLAVAVDAATDGTVDTSVQGLNTTLQGKDFSPTIQVPEPVIIQTPIVIPVEEPTIDATSTAPSSGFNF
jgi:hypothetical protein